MGLLRLPFNPQPFALPPPPGDHGGGGVVGAIRTIELQLSSIMSQEESTQRVLQNRPTSKPGSSEVAAGSGTAGRGQVGQAATRPAASSAHSTSASHNGTKAGGGAGGTRVDRAMAESSKGGVQGGGAAAAATVAAAEEEEEEEEDEEAADGAEALRCLDEALQGLRNAKEQLAASEGLVGGGRGGGLL